MGGTRTPVRDETYDFVVIDGEITIEFTAQHDDGEVVDTSDHEPQIVVSGGVGTMPLASFESTCSKARFMHGT